jgi:hypothetical protein
MMIDYSLILKINYDGSEYTLNGDEYAGLTWLSKTKKPTKDELDAQWEEVLAKVETKKAETKAKREAAEAKLAALGLTSDDFRALGL